MNRVSAAWFSILFACVFELLIRVYCIDVGVVLKSAGSIGGGSFLYAFPWPNAMFMEWFCTLILVQAHFGVSGVHLKTNNRALTPKRPELKSDDGFGLSKTFSVQVVHCVGNAVVIHLLRPLSSIVSA